MNDQMQDLARRAVACKHWKWMSGMALMSDTLQGKSVTRGTRAIGRQRQHPMGIGCVCDAINLDGDRGGYVGALPDLTDSATLGCLLALVREAWGKPIWLEPDTREIGDFVGDWCVIAFCGGFVTEQIGNGLTEASALVAALEAAP